jgi:RHS repeat-associated protein
MGELLSQVVQKAGTPAPAKESSYYSYNGRGDVDGITDENGDNRSTYGYSAYGGSDAAGSSGIAAGGQQVGTEPYNAFQFGTGRVDASSGNYQMGGRTYSPALNRFLSMDLYNGALSDLSLAASPFTSNRYGFAGGNPLNMIDSTGHWPSWSDIGHATLDVVGLVPVVGEAADLANAGWYAAEGDYTNAALSAASAIPFAGYAATAVKAGKYGTKAAKAIIKGGDEAVTVVKDVTKGTEAATPVATTGVKTGTKAGTKTTEKAAAQGTETATGVTGTATRSATPPKPKPKQPPAKPSGAGDTGPGFFRGAKPGEAPNFAPRPNEFKVDASTGSVRPTHGVSVFDNPASVSSKGFVPHEVDLTSIPNELRIIQRGSDLRHFEIVPRAGTSLTPERFTELLCQITCKAGG